ncbi:MAG: hypothetical protein AB8B62_16190 [Roseobacter sp.]
MCDGLSDPHGIDVLWQLMGSENEAPVQAYACQENGQSWVRAALVEALLDSVPNVRADAMSALTDLSSQTTC